MPSDTDDILMLFSHCIIVQGASRASICDLQRNKVYLIPNAFAGLFTDGRYFDSAGIMAELDEESKVILKEYIDFLEDKELAFYCSDGERENFPQLSEEWLFPAHISNCILDASGELEYFNEAFLDQLGNLCCNYIQFRFYAPVTLSYLEQLLQLINKAQVKSVSLLLPGADEPDFEEKIAAFVKRNGKIGQLTLHSSAADKLVREGIAGTGVILQTKETITGHSYCGLVHSALFSINIPTYTESLAHNSCLNRKIGIDTEGNIKNCPSTKEHFGNIKDTTLREAIDNPGFKKYWHITKDQVKVCSDCEFRHICTDCRAYLEDPEDDYSKPLKCGYNPYTCQWESWSTHPMKQDAIAAYRIPVAPVY